LEAAVKGGGAGGSQYRSLQSAVATQLDKMDAGSPALHSDTAWRHGHQPYREPHLTSRDANHFMEVFWDLFRQGFITLGMDENNQGFPWYRVSYVGRKAILEGNSYFFHDLATYVGIVNEAVPQLDDVTLIYLKEAMQDHMSGCYLSAAVMLGVAAEHTFMLMLEAIEGNVAHAATFKSAFGERSLLKRVEKFRRIVESNPKLIPAEIREDLDTRILGALSMIRTFRNDSGHPTGKLINRDQSYVNLSIFPHYAQTIYELIDYFNAP
jgi:hypothetical protein